MVRHHEGAVMWFTGLSGAGKTTTARHLAEQLKSMGCRVEMLDGDELRETICKGLGFSKEDRMENIRRIVYVSKLLARNGVFVLVSAITPYLEMREHARAEIERYVEIFVDCPLSECERRDVKGLYAKARRQEIQRFTGISDPYETPVHPEITIDTATHSIEANTAQILNWLETAGLLDACKEEAV